MDALHQLEKIFYSNFCQWWCIVQQNMAQYYMNCQKYKARKQENKNVRKYKTMILLILCYPKYGARCAIKEICILCNRKIEHDGLCYKALRMPSILFSTIKMAAC